MLEANNYLWQAEIFFSMSTKVTDPALAVSLQNVAQQYLSKAVQLRDRESTVSTREGPKQLSPAY
jgi:hypothetical protein